MQPGIVQMGIEAFKFFNIFFNSKFTFRCIDITTNGITESFMQRELHLNCDSSNYSNNTKIFIWPFLTLWGKFIEIQH